MGLWDDQVGEHATTQAVRQSLGLAAGLTAIPSAIAEIAERSGEDPPEHELREGHQSRRQAQVSIRANIRRQQPNSTYISTISNPKRVS